MNEFPNYVWVGFDHDSGEPKQVHPVKPHGDFIGFDWQMYFPADFAGQQVERLKAIVDMFEPWGSDECKSCETGRITLFVANKKCMACDPESYHKNYPLGQRRFLKESLSIALNALLEISDDNGWIQGERQSGPNIGKSWLEIARCAISDLERRHKGDSNA